MRWTSATVRETIGSSFLVALLSGVIAVGFFMAIGAVVLLAILPLSLVFNTDPLNASAFLDLLVGMAMSPVMGAIGAILWWRMTLPFGLISALAQQLFGPSRRISVAIGTLYGAAWAMAIGHVEPMPLPGHSMGVQSNVFGLSAHSVDGRLFMMALYAAIGAAVGLLMPWRFLLRSWGRGRTGRSSLSMGPLFSAPVRPFRWIRRHRDDDPSTRDDDQP